MILTLQPQATIFPPLSEIFHICINHRYWVRRLFVQSLYWAKNQIVLGEVYVLCSCTQVQGLPCLASRAMRSKKATKRFTEENQNLQMTLMTISKDLCPQNQLFGPPPLSIYLESTIFRPNSHFLPQVSLSRSPTCPRPRLYGALTQQLLWSSVDYLAVALAAFAACDVTDILPYQLNMYRNG